MGLNNDNITILYYAKLLLKGFSFGTDIVEINPPLIFFIYTLPSYLSNVIDIPVKYSLDIFTLFYIGTSIFLCHKTLKKASANITNTTYHLSICIISTGLIILPCISLVTDSIIAIGDRIHLFIIFTLPYMLSSMPSFRKVKINNNVTIIIALMAAIGFCIKPNYAIFWLTINIFLAVNERSIRKVFFRLENIIIYIFAILYICLVIIFYPEYITKVIPILSNSYYAINQSIMIKIIQLFPTLSLLFFILALYTPIYFSKLKNKMHFKNDILYLIFLLFSSIGFIFSTGGWIYTYYPFHIFSLFLLFIIVCEISYLKKTVDDHKLLKKYAVGSLIITASSIVTVILMLSLSKNVIQDTLNNKNRHTPYMNGNIIAKTLTEYIDKNSKTGSFTILSISGPWDSILAKPDITKKQSVQHFQYLWMIPGLYDNIKNNERQIDPIKDMNHSKKWIWKYTTDKISKDLSNNPEIVIIDTSCRHRGFGSNKFNILDFFMANKSFVKNWKNYKYKQTINFTSETNDLCKKYDIYTIS